MKKDTVKKLILNPIKVLAFVVAFFLIIQTLSDTIFSAVNNASKNQQMANAYAFTEDDPQTIDIVCLGNSDAYSAFAPITLWENFGYTSTVCASPHQLINDSRTLLENVRKTQDVKLVFLDVDLMYDGKQIDEVISTRPTIFDNFFQTADPESFETFVERKFPVFTYHNLWKNQKKKSKRREYSHGYVLIKDTVKIPKSNYMEVTDEMDYPISTNINALKSFVLYCRNNDIDVVLVEMPSVTSWNYARHNAMQEISDEMGVEFLDLNLAYDEIGIDQTNCFRDKGNHLNHESAVAVTKYFGNYIQQNYDIEDHRNDSRYSERWDSDTANYKKHYKVKE